MPLGLFRISDFVLRIFPVIIPLIMHNKSTIYTDGSSRGNPGPGGWASIISFDGVVVELGGSEKITTNNRMEMLAVISALDYMKSKNKENIVHTDSSYVLNGATKWVSGWKRNNWKTQAGGEVLNKDLWMKLDDLLGKVKVSWQLVPGHAGVPANERCDEIATSFADGEVTPLYSGGEKDYPVDLSLSPDAFKEKKATKKSGTGKAYSYVSMVLGKIMVHKTWAECEARVKGVSGTKFKKVFSKEEEGELFEKWRG
jgi:ribonuclease HI